MFKYWKIKQLNKRASSPKFQPQAVIKSLAIKSGDVIADIGAGGGYYTFEFAKLVGEQGRVYAIDTEVKFLKYIDQQINQLKINNIRTVLIKNDVLGLPLAGIDLFFLRNVYHHLPSPQTYFMNLKKYLKPTGRVAIIDYARKRFTLFLRGKHYTPESAIIENMTNCGYTILNRFTFLLPDQSFLIFQIK